MMLEILKGCQDIKIISSLIVYRWVTPQSDEYNFIFIYLFSEVLRMQIYVYSMYNTLWLVLLASNMALMDAEPRTRSYN